ncbi:MAG TPA: hypothetical protein VGM19_14435 [Armatimonadota bacterium]|jgi:hypothetical protein
MSALGVVELYFVALPRLFEGVTVDSVAVAAGWSVVAASGLTYSFWSSRYPRQLDVFEVGLSLSYGRRTDFIPWEQVLGFGKDTSGETSSVAYRYTSGDVTNEVVLLTKRGVMRFLARPAVFLLWPFLDKVNGDPEAVVSIIEGKIAQREAQPL